MAEIPTLNFCKKFFGMKLDGLKECANSLESYLTKEVAALERRHREQTERMTPGQRVEFHDIASDEYFRLTETFPQTLRVSLFIHAYSLFEHSFNELAKTMASLRGIKIKPEDMNGKGIMRSKTYFQKVVLIDVPFEGQIWGEITTLNAIRNLFVHSEGYLPKENTRNERNYIASSNGALKLVQEGDSSRITIASELFNRNVLKTFERFNDDLFDALLENSRTQNHFH
jgi:hypothetical protein